jgi:hypothetical protein
MKRRIWRRQHHQRRLRGTQPPLSFAADGRRRRVVSRSIRAGIVLDHLPAGTTQQLFLAIAPEARAPIRLEMNMVVKILPNQKSSPTGKLADAEVHFTDGTLQGLRLLGFAVWEKRNGTGRSVSFPSRAYSVNGERRNFSLLRPISDLKSQERIRDEVLHAYAEFEAQSAVAS